MAFRGVYIIDHKAVYEKSTNSVIFRRLFRPVEKKCEKCMGQKYCKIPPNFPDLIVEALQLYRSVKEKGTSQDVDVKNQFVQKYDSCSTVRCEPVHTLLDGKLSPVVAFEKDGLVYACIVFEETFKDADFEQPKNVFKSSGVITAYEMLQNMAFYVGRYDHETNLIEKCSVLNKYVATGFPFGQPVELDINTCLAMASTCNGVAIPKIKGPIWRPVAFKGKHLLQMEAREEVRALQFDKAELPNACQIYGYIDCKVDIDESPEISFNLMASLDSLVHNQMVYHSCVQLVDDEIVPVINNKKVAAGSLAEYGSRKIRFIPPYESFKLCYYTVKLEENDFPVEAYYQMKGDMLHAQVMIQLKISPKLKNSFEYFNVFIPFFNRGSIVALKCLTSSATLNVTPDKAALVWSIGTKLPGKSTDISLEAAVTFDGPILRRSEKMTGLNSYIDEKGTSQDVDVKNQISWNVNEFTYSGVKVDPKSVEFYPHNKIKVNSASSFRTTEYRVWNSHGNVTNPSFVNPNKQKTTYIPEET